MGVQEEKFEDIFDKYTYIDNVGSSLRSYSNWLLGISIGLATVLITISMRYENIDLLVMIPLVLVFGGILFNGYIKREFFIREIKMNVYLGKLKKMLVLYRVNNQDSSKIDKEKWDQIFNEYWNESEKLFKIGRYMDYSSFLTFINVIITGLVILFMLYENAC